MDFGHPPMVLLSSLRLVFLHLIMNLVKMHLSGSDYVNLVIKLSLLLVVSVGQSCCRVLGRLMFAPGGWLITELFPCSLVNMRLVLGGSSVSGFVGVDAEGCVTCNSFTCTAVTLSVWPSCRAPVRVKSFSLASRLVIISFISCLLSSAAVKLHFFACNFVQLNKSSWGSSARMPSAIGS